MRSNCLLRPLYGAKCCDEPSVCPSVRTDISATTRPNFAKFSVHIACSRGSVLLRRRFDTLRTSGFVIDVMISSNGPYGGVTLRQQPRWDIVSGLRCVLRGRRRAPRPDESFVYGMPGAKLAMHRCQCDCRRRRTSRSSWPTSWPGTRRAAFRYPTTTTTTSTRTRTS